MSRFQEKLDSKSISFGLKPSTDQDRTNKEIIQIGPSVPNEIGFKHIYVHKYIHRSCCYSMKILAALPLNSSGFAAIKCFRALPYDGMYISLAVRNMTKITCLQACIENSMPAEFSKYCKSIGIQKSTLGIMLNIPWRHGSRTLFIAWIQAQMYAGKKVLHSALWKTSLFGVNCVAKSLQKFDFFTL